ncbi:hypothetical protein AC579_3607 [Pseudocercospora musae]|uniref:Protein transport protein SFT2 n=1 Tax=Pseudocercospora musae TaxID=113226 RepID=A0A139IT46_9PEZI|nr:hypothetical protein AC579_3607 [Pseudocercospora musae]
MASASFRDSMNSLGWSRREQTANTNPQNPLLGTLSKLNPFSGDGYVRLPTTEGEGPGAPLPARTRREEEEGWFALSRWDRLLLFGGLNLAAIALFVVCFTLLPILSLRPRKFAILCVSLPLLLSRQFQICTLVQLLPSTVPYLLYSREGVMLSPRPHSPAIYFITVVTYWRVESILAIDATRNRCSIWSMASALFLGSWAVMMGPLQYLRHLVSQERLPFTATYFGSIALTLYFAVGVSRPLTSPFVGTLRSRCHTTITYTPFTYTACVDNIFVADARSIMRRMHTLAAAPSMTPRETMHTSRSSRNARNVLLRILTGLPYLDAILLQPITHHSSNKPWRLVLTVVMILATYRCPDTLADTTFAASQHYLDAIDIDSPACRTGVVPRELLPYGLAGSAVCGKLWRESPLCMDGWIVPALSSVRSSMYELYRYEFITHASPYDSTPRYVCILPSRRRNRAVQTFSTFRHLFWALQDFMQSETLHDACDKPH